MSIHKPPEFIEKLDSLQTQDYFEISNFLTIDEVMALREVVQHLVNLKVFRPAKIGANRLLEKRIRSDEIFWIDEKIISESILISGAIEPYFSRLEEIQKHLNAKFFLGLTGLETHFSIYHPKDFYERHLDVSPQSLRQLSLVCYLNTDWNLPDGGQLRIFREGADPLIVDPTCGKLIGFLSATTEHEVLTTQRDRLSLTSWFLTSPQAV